MEWQFSDDRPIYLQLMEGVKLRIVSGLYAPGDKLPAVRELAAQAAVNPNTMQKALGELEREGLVYSQRTSGRFITEDKTMIESTKEGLAKEQINAFFEKMNAMGFDRREVLALIEKTAKEAEGQ